MGQLDQILEGLLESPSAAPTLSEVNEWLDTYPYFTFPALLLLKRRPAEVDEAARRALIRRIALASPDARTLFALLGSEVDKPEPFYPDAAPVKPATNDAIDTFLDRYGHPDPGELALLERLIFNPTPDYSSILEREEEAQRPGAQPGGGQTQDDLIDAFIRSQRAAELPVEPPTLPEVTPLADDPRPAAPAPDDSSLSESLAKIYIRRKRYDKAFEIIHTLSLKNPKKSVYFADQLRFLRKLMLNRGIQVPGEEADNAN